MHYFGFTIQDYFLELNILLFILFLLVYFWLLGDLIKHMRTMVRLKYHSDERAEFDEGRVKFVIGAVFFIWLAYILTWVYSLVALDDDNSDDQRIIIRLFSVTTLCLVIGAYALYFINNRVQGDIKHIKEKNPDSRPDQSQDFNSHL